jgi:YHS domain-containing protein
MAQRVSAIALSLLGLTITLPAQQAARVEALDGVDVVRLVTTGKEVFGKGVHRSTHEGMDYLFESAETKDIFDKEPSKYAVQMGGLCAYMGGTVTGNPSNYALHDGRIYIFGTDNCRKAFLASPASYLPPSALPLPTDPGAVERGLAVIDKVATAHGGPRLDAMRSYVEAFSTKQARPAGEVTIGTTLSWTFPEGARMERTVPLQQGPMTMATLLTQNAAWQLAGDGRARAVRSASLPSLQLEMGRQLLPLLRTRRSPGTDVAALDTVTVGGVTVERVRIVRGGLDVILQADAATGRAHSLVYVARGPENRYGSIVVTYRDFRTVDGLVVPFEETGTFDGQPTAALSRALDRVEIDPRLDPSLFGAPKAGGQ